MRVLHVLFGAVSTIIDCIVAPIMVVVIVAGTAARRCSPTDGRHGLVVIDAAYSYRQVVEWGIEQSVIARSCDGYFDHTWSVHPMVGADGPDSSYGALKVHALSHDHDFVEARLALSKRWMPFPLTGFLLTQAQLLRFLRALVRTGKVSAVRVGDPLYLGLVGYLLTRRTGVPFTIRVNGDYDRSYAETGLANYPRLFRWRIVEKWIERFLLSRAALVVAPTREYLGYAVDNGVKVGATAVVPFGNLLNPVHFSPLQDRLTLRHEFGIGDAPMLVAVTRLEPIKRPLDLVKVISRVCEISPSAVCVVVGGGSLEGALLALAEDLGVLPSLMLVGHQNQERIASLLADADVVVAPMMGRALVEASLSGTPIVAYETDWHDELIVHGETGLLVPFSDSDAMANAALRLLRDSTLASTLGEQARSRSIATMSSEAVSELDRRAWVTVFGD